MTDADEVATGMALLRDFAARHSIATAARQIGKSRTAVSLALSGKYPAGLGPIAVAALAALGQRPCPALGGADAAPAQCLACTDKIAAGMPTHSPAAAADWRARRSCQKETIAC